VAIFIPPALNPFQVDTSTIYVALEGLAGFEADQLICTEPVDSAVHDQAGNAQKVIVEPKTVVELAPNQFIADTWA